MSTAITEGIAQGITPQFEPLTVQQYRAMVTSGILIEGSPIELIDGLLIRKDRRDEGGSIMTVGPRHAFIVMKLGQLLEQLLDESDFHARCQQPVTLTGTSEPEPDVSVAQGEIADYRSHHPGPSEIAMVVEVADSSLEFDRTAKQRLYAAAGIPEYWIINLRENVVEAYLRPLPAEERYQDSVTYRDSLEFALGGQPYTLDVSELLGDSPDE